MDYIATFYSHFGAIRFNRDLKKLGILGQIMPVPRNLSSSCGTCVAYTAPDNWLPDNIHAEIEKIVRLNNGTYIQVYVAKDS